MTEPVKRGRGRPKGYPKSGGKAKGFKAPATLEKEAAREAVRQRITQRIVPLVDAQIDSAIGIKHFFLRDEFGQWKRITKPERIEEALNAGKGYWIYTKDPNSQAARDMLDRAIDRPKEQVQEIAVTNTDALVASLMAGRQRAAAAKGQK